MEMFFFSVKTKVISEFRIDKIEIEGNLIKLNLNLTILRFTKISIQRKCWIIEKSRQEKI